MPGNNFLLQHVTQRYSLTLPEQTRHLHSTLHSAGLEKEFISRILLSFEENTFSASEFEPFPIVQIIEYIQRTHALYLQKILPEIEQSIQLLHNYYEAGHPVLQELQTFYQQYYKELWIHVNEEETRLLPYIIQLLKAKREPKAFSEFVLSFGGYSIQQFLAGHHDTEDEVAIIRKIMLLYAPSSVNQSLYRILLLQLQTFEQDLHVHAHLEEEVLIPKALKIEAKLKDKLGRSTKSN